MSRSILDYFKKDRAKAALPDPRGPLSNVISLAIIVATNNEVYKVLESRLDRSLTCEPSEKRGAYNKYTPEFKATTAKYAIENGNSRAARKFSTYRHGN